MSNHYVTVSQLTADFGSQQPKPYLNVLCNDYHWLGVHGHLGNGKHFLGRHKLGSVIFVCLEAQEWTAQLDLLMERYPDYCWMEIEEIKI